MRVPDGADSLKKGPEGRHRLRRPVSDTTAPIVPQPNIAPGDDPKYVAEIWWHIGDWEFDQLDLARRRGRRRAVGGLGLQPRGERVRRTRCSTRSRRSTASRSTSTPGRSSSSSATRRRSREFVHLLNYTDEQEKLTGDPGADFRQRGVHVHRRARSTTSTSSGPAAGGAVHQRAPTSSTPRRAPPRPRRSCTSRSIACRTRARSRRTSPGRSRSTRRSRIEFRSHQPVQERARRRTSSCWTSGRWTRRRPTTQNAIAEVYDLLGAADEGGRRSAASTSRRCSRRARRSRSTSATRPGSTRTRTTRSRSSAPRSSCARASRARPSRTRATARRRSSRPTRRAIRRRSCASRTYALQEYKLAAIGWLGYLKQDENAPDAYKSRYFYADALHNQVRLEVALHQFDPKLVPGAARRRRSPTADQAAVDVRDSDEDDQFIDNAGLFVVDLADVDRDLAFQRWQDSGGTQGVEPRKDPKLEGTGRRQEGRRGRRSRTSSRRRCTRATSTSSACRRSATSRTTRPTTRSTRPTSTTSTGTSIRPSRASRPSTRTTAARTRSATRRGSASS